MNSQQATAVATTTEEVTVVISSGSSFCYPASAAIMTAADAAMATAFSETFWAMTAVDAAAITAAISS